MASLKEIGEKRQKKWKESKIYQVKEDKNKKKFYTLDMFPYPSGAGLHVGHPKGYIASDVLARKKMLEGFSVIHPMGFDTFGLGTENYAIEHKMKPQIVAKQNIETFISQLEKIGLTYDRDRSVNTADPDYFRRTQRIFLQLFTHYYDEKEGKAKPISELEKKIKSGEIPLSEGEGLGVRIDRERLAYVDYKPINRCPKCMTGLANEDLDDGKCERCGSEVEQKPMRQRVLRITKYAERLITGLDKLSWDESMKDLERNRIGKSEGTQFTMKIKSPLSGGEGLGVRKFEVYTTRIDTVFGMSFVVMAPEHPLVDQITTDEFKANIAAYKEQAKYKSQLERTELQKEKTGQFTGAYAINPFNNEEIPIYIGDYVLANYGTGVVMAVPAHDERDFEFAKKYNIKITQSIMPTDQNPHEGAERRYAISAIVQRPSDNKFLFLKRKKFGWISPVIGGIEGNEEVLIAAEREVFEETGYSAKAIKKIGRLSESNYFAENKNVRRQRRDQAVLLTLTNETPNKVSNEELDKHEAIRLTYNEALEQTSHKDNLLGLLTFIEGEKAYTQKGTLINSGEFSDLSSDEAIVEMQKWLKKNNIGGKKCNYKIQDRVFSRQRYRGEPFPVIFCNHCNTKTSINFYDQKTREGIVSGKKTIETRALNPEESNRYFGNIKEGDSILAVNKETNKELRLQITKTYQWKNLKDMRENTDKEIVEKMCSDKEKFRNIKDLKTFSAGRDFTPGYLDKIEKNGIIGREIKVIGPEVVPMKESDLPLTLPDVENYAPTGTEEGPLAAISERINTTCPICGKPAKRESNTMPGRAGSSRYRLRYMDNKNDKELVSPEKEKYRGNVDVYIGGAEHVTRHMIYARFRQKFLFDIGVVTHDEPFQKYHKVGLIMAEDGRKMSKRRNNVVNPDDIIAEYGADTLRTYEMFMGPFEQSIARSTNGMKGIKKFLDKIIALKDKIGNEQIIGNNSNKSSEILLHQTIKKLTEDIDDFKHNTAVSQLMILVNHLTEQPSISKEIFEKLVILMSPFAPHLAEELWEQLGNKYSVFTTAVWPSYDENYLVADRITLPVQFNGKMRGTLETSKNAGEKDILDAIAADTKLSAHLTGTPNKVIYIPGKIINIII